MQTLKERAIGHMKRTDEMKEASDMGEFKKAILERHVADFETDFAALLPAIEAAGIKYKATFLKSEMPAKKYILFEKDGLSLKFDYKGPGQYRYFNELFYGEYDIDGLSLFLYNKFIKPFENGPDSKTDSDIHPVGDSTEGEANQGGGEPQEPPGDAE